MVFLHRNQSDNSANSTHSDGCCLDSTSNSIRPGTTGCVCVIYLAADEIESVWCRPPTFSTRWDLGLGEIRLPVDGPGSVRRLLLCGPRASWAIIYADRRWCTHLHTTSHAHGVLVEGHSAVLALKIWKCKCGFLPVAWLWCPGTLSGR